MIDDVDRTLRSLLERSLGLTPDQVYFDRPDERFAQTVKSPRALCIYLCDVRENRDLRSAEFSVERRSDGAATVRPPAMYFELTYLVTAWADKRETEHELLSQALKLLLGHPTLDGELLQGSLREQGMALPASVGSPDSVTDPMALWSGLGGIRPALFYSVTVPVQPFAAEERRLVTSRLLRTVEKDRDGQMPVDGRSPEEAAEFAGKVRAVRGRGAVAEAQVSLREVSRSAAADAEGNYRLGWVKPGTYTLVVSAPGYREARKQIVVGSWAGLDRPDSPFDVELETE